MKRRTFLAAAAVPLVAPGKVPPSTTLFRQAMHAYRLGTPAGMLQAHALFTHLLVLHPQHARATAMLAAVYRQYVTLGLTDNTHDDAREHSLLLSTRAVTLAAQEAPPHPALPWVLEQRGWIALYLEHNHGAAIQAAIQALAHTPRFFPAYALHAHTAAYQGNPRLSLQLTARERSLNPSPSGMSDFHEGHAYVVWAIQSQDMALWDMAQSALHRALAIQPQHLPTRAYLAAALCAMDHTAAARAVMPPFAAAVRTQLPYVHQETLAHLIRLWDALREGTDTTPTPEDGRV